MDLAQGRSLGGMSSMDELLSLPFDLLWSTSSMGSRPSLRRGSSYSLPTPEIDYEAVLALGGPPMVHSHSVVQPANDGEVYQDVVQLDDTRVKRGVKRQVLVRIPNKTIPKDHHPPQCHICMENFNGDITAKQLPCKHIFCKECIYQWLSDHDTCPTCRWKFPEEQTHMINPRQ